MKSNEHKYSAPVIISGKKNVNGRIYDGECVNKIHSEINQKIINAGVYGELNHPDSFDVSLKNISHIIESCDIKYTRVPRKLKKHLKKTKSYIDYKLNNLSTISANIRILKTQKGGEVTNIINEFGASKLSLALRAAGSVGTDGLVNIDKVFTFDIINSADDSFVKAPLKKII